MAEDCGYCGAKSSVEYDLCVKCRVRERYDEDVLAQAYNLTKSNKAIAIVLGILGPAGYAYIKRWDLLVLNVFTFNYFMLGFILVPIHIFMLFDDAEAKTKGI
jgi:hypothetical protein